MTGSKTSESCADCWACCWYWQQQRSLVIRFKKATTMRHQLSANKRPSHLVQHVNAKAYFPARMLNAGSSIIVIALVLVRYELLSLLCALIQKQRAITRARTRRQNEKGDSVCVLPAHWMMLYYLHKLCTVIEFLSSSLSTPFCAAFLARHSWKRLPVSTRRKMKGSTVPSSKRAQDLLGRRKAARLLRCFPFELSLIPPLRCSDYSCCPLRMNTEREKKSKHKTERRAASRKEVIIAIKIHRKRRGGT